MARLLDDFTDQLNAGQQPDIDAWLDRHPEQAATIRPVLEALLSLYDISQNGAAPLDPAYAGESTGIERRLGDFRILRELGRGGMGVVYRAEQLSMGRTVALKVLPFAAVLDEKAVTRFKNEARAAGTLHHPNIVPVHSVGNEQGVHYYAMALIEGLTLAEVIRELNEQVFSGDGGSSSEFRLKEVMRCLADSIHRSFEEKSTADDATTDYGMKSKWPELTRGTARTARDVQAAISTRRSSFDRCFFQQVAKIGIQAGEALHHAHEHGIVHRDIKPGNLMIDGTGKLWVTDFGLARIATDPCLTMTGDLVGTLRYMAPEQALAHRIVVDHRADIYSLGVTLYELMTLRPAFDAASREGLLKQLAFDEPPPLRQMNPCIPIDLATIVGKAMSKSPDERYVSAQCMVADLQAFLNDRPIAARPPTLLQRAGKWSSRNMPLVASAAVILIVATLGMAISNFAIGRERNKKVAALANATRALESERRARSAEQAARTDAERSTIRAGHSAAEAYHQQYRAEMQLGLIDLETGNLARLYRTLVRHLPEPGRADRRGWEWYYLLSNTEQGRTLGEHTRPVSSIAWSPDGRFLATTSHDGDCVVWDARSGHRVRRFSPGQTLKRGVAWSPDSQRLAWGSAGPENAVRVWDRRTDAIQVLRGHTHSLVACSWSPDGTRLATASMDGTAMIWDPEAGTCLHVLRRHPIHVLAICWLQDGGSLVTVGHGGVKLWDARTGELLRELLSADHIVSASITDFPSPRIALANESGTCRMIDTDTWEEVQTIGLHRSGIKAAALSPDGATFASLGEDGTTSIWNIVDGQRLFLLQSHNGKVESMAWNPSGRQLAAGCGDGTIRVWNVPPSPADFLLQAPPNPMSSLIWSDNNRLLTGVDRNTTARTTWDWATGTAVDTFLPPPGLQQVFSPDGRLRATTQEEGDGLFKILIQDVERNEALCKLHFQRISDYGWPSIAWSPDGSRLAAFEYRHVEVWGIPDGRRTFMWDGPELNAIAWSPDSLRLGVAGGGAATGSGFQRYMSHVHLFDVERKSRIQKVRFGSERVTASSLSWHPEGKFFAAGNANGLVGVWDSETGREVVTVPMHVAAVRALDWTPDGSRVVSVGRDGSLKIWDPLTGDELFSLLDHQRPLSAVRWSLDGTRLAAADDQGQIRIWQAAVGHNVVATADHHRTLARMHATRAGESEDRSRELIELSRAIELAPGNSRFRRLRAVALAREGRLEESLLDLTAALDLDPEDVHILRTRVEVCAALGRWPEALADVARLIELKQSPYWDYQQAVLLLKLGHSAAYRKLCQQILSESYERSYGSFAAMTCALAPHAITDYERLLPRIREYVAIQPPPPSPSDVASLGALLYRAGRVEEAIDRLSEASRVWEQAGVSTTGASPYELSPGHAWYFLAMAYHDMGRFEESRFWYAKAEAFTQATLANPVGLYKEGAMDWCNRVALGWLQRECRTTLGIR